MGANVTTVKNEFDLELRPFTQVDADTEGETEDGATTDPCQKVSTRTRVVRGVREDEETLS